MQEGQRCRSGGEPVKLRAFYRWPVMFGGPGDARCRHVGESSV